MNPHDLESWAIRAAQELQELVDDAEEAVAYGERNGVALSAKVLLKEFDDIFHGRPAWGGQLASMRSGQDTDLPGLDLDGDE